MMKTEYAENGGFLQRDSVEHEEYAEACSTESREVDRKDGADLLEKVLSRDNLNKAYKRVKANKGASGVDGMSVNEALPWLKEHMLYNVTTMASTWHTVATKDVRLLKRQMNQLSELPKDYIFLNYLRCHDDIGRGLDYDWLKQFGISEIPHKKFLNDYFTGRFPDSNARGELYNNDPRLGDARLCGTTASLCGIETAKKVTGKEIKVIEEERRVGDPEILIASSDKAKNILGCKPEYDDISTIIETAWKWHCTHLNGYLSD